MKILALKTAGVMIALSLLASGCTSTEATTESEKETVATNVSCLTEGNELLDDKYESTGVVSVEKIRMPIRSSFEASVNICKSYAAKAIKSPAYNNFYKSVEGKSEDEINAAFASLPTEDQKSIKAFEKENEAITDSIAKLILDVGAQAVALHAIDPTSAFSSISMWNMPSALSGLADTGSELLYITDSLGEIYNVSKVLSALEAAE